MKHILPALIGLFLAIQLHGMPGIAVGGSSGSSGVWLKPFQPDPGSIKWDYYGTEVYCLPQNRAAAEYALNLVGVLEFEILGKDLPLPKVLVFKDHLTHNGKDLYGIEWSGMVAVEINHPMIQITRTVFHEFMHVAGLTNSDHPYINAKEEEFGQLLLARGYR